MFDEILLAYPEFKQGNIFGKVSSRYEISCRKRYNPTHLRLFTVYYDEQGYQVTFTLDCRREFRGTITPICDTQVERFDTQAEVVKHLKWLL